MKTIELYPNIRDNSLYEGGSFAQFRKIRQKELLSGETQLSAIKRAAECKNKHLGERAFFIGNGPSLSAKDLDLLQNELTFGFNKINLIYPQTDWRPTYYIFQDLCALEHTLPSLDELDSQLFLPDTANKVEDPSIVKYRAWSIMDKSEFRFTPDPIKGFCARGTVIYTALQLAWHMGIREFYFLGVDCNYSAAGDELKGKPPEDRIYESKGEKTHFHPDYYCKGSKWLMADVDSQMWAFNKFASLVARSPGAFACNCTRGGKLESFERQTLEEVLAKPKRDNNAADIELPNALVYGTDTVAQRIRNLVEPHQKVIGYVSARDDAPPEFDGLPTQALSSLGPRNKEDLFFGIKPSLAKMETLTTNDFPATQICILDNLFRYYCFDESESALLDRSELASIDGDTLIFGASRAGSSALKSLPKGINFIGFLDNDNAKQGKRLDGYPVQHPTVLARYPQATIIIASMYQREIEQQLLQEYKIDAARLLEYSYSP